MRTKREKNRTGKARKNISLTGLFTMGVMAIVLCALLIALWIFIEIYRGAIEQNAITSSGQAVDQVENTITNYIEDMDSVMDMIEESYLEEENEALDEQLQKLLDVRRDVVAVTTYDENGEMLGFWAGKYRKKTGTVQNLSYLEAFETMEEGKLTISMPHVESLFINYYPWVVTVTRCMENETGEKMQVAMDIRFRNISQFVNSVGIGQHGYCYIGDENGNIVYHPQQEMIYYGLKEEKVRELQEGTYTDSNMIYTVKSIPNCDWYVVGISYVDEMITGKLKQVLGNVLLILVIALLGTFLVGQLFARLFARPANRLAEAMGEFEQKPDTFGFEPVNGTREVMALSDSFEHMTVRIKQLMEQVRREEITLRKAQLNALQAQINPHFLYNTLDAIVWMCEDERNSEAKIMTRALARLFRISISKGHELITVKDELQHAQNYLQIEKFRYKNQFTYSFDVEEECLPFYCNKITLQPIIENAIYHGIDRMVEEGTIRIGIHMDGDDIVFTVEDDGVGMSPEQCQEIFRKDRGENAGIGIQNVNDRIKIYFGERYGLSIQSVQDEGTCVTIRIPRVAERNDYESEL